VSGFWSDGVFLLCLVGLRGGFLSRCYGVTSESVSGLRLFDELVETLSHISGSDADIIF
jgi:hypothetical protein